MSARNGGASKKGSGKRRGNKSASSLIKSGDARKARAVTRRDQSRHVRSRIRRKLRQASA